MSYESLDSGVRLWVEERGEGRPILFIHGWPTGHAVWKNQIPALAARHKVLAVDLPSFGKSPAVPKPTMAHFAELVRELVDKRGFSDTLLIGWSLGAGVVMQYCQQFGSHGLRAIGIVDDCPKLYPGPDWQAEIDTPFSRELIADWRERWLEGERRSVLLEATRREFKDPDLYETDVEWLVEESLKADPIPAMEALLDVMELDFRASLARLEVPALLLYGQHSRMTTAANRTYMNQTIPDATLVVFSESAHNPMIEEVEKFNHAVDEFASRV
jgi:non-heme chloroperoxidase